MDKREQERQLLEATKLLNEVREEMSRRVIGQDRMIDGLLMGIIAGGHVLIEGVPGLAKTLAVKTFSEVMDAGFKRIQFTPDLLPADLIGTMIFKQQTGEFIPRKGPIFSNVILADEINRAPAKVQSALLEAMQEGQVTIGENTFKLPSPFFVLATQNPIEQEGTYQLPEAQLDRFILKLRIEYPSHQEELEILRMVVDEPAIPPRVKKVLNSSTLASIKEAVKNVTVDERIEAYIVSIIAATREKDRKQYPFARFLEFGASPRATIYLYRCARIRAVFEGRTYVLPEDVKAVSYDVLRHRIVLSYEAEAEGMSPDDVITHLLSAVSVP
ncbi:AAA family ATPase [Spirochaeta cellobiosiphila]|uniref:AAA family ATPase n=1 Tax=Spirochaeta cellobiosiphila TaxID=504483 RepID=UPI00041485B5|nr:MoxR family ATPase [Spirochaeta cellobiosiphila]